MKVDPTLKRILNEVSEETGIPVDNLTEMADFALKFVVQSVESDDMPKIVLDRLGTFSPNRKKISWKLHQLTSQPEPTEEQVAEIQKLIRVRERQDANRINPKKKNKL